MSRAQLFVEDEVPTLHRTWKYKRNETSPANVVKRGQTGERFNVIVPSYYGHRSTEIRGDQSIRTALRNARIPHHRKSIASGSFGNQYQTTIFVNEPSKYDFYMDLSNKHDYEGLKAHYGEMSKFIRSAVAEKAALKDDLELLNFMLDLGANPEYRSSPPWPHDHDWYVDRIVHHPAAARILVRRGLLDLGDMTPNQLATLGLTHREYADHAKRLLGEL